MQKDYKLASFSQCFQATRANIYPLALAVNVERLFLYIRAKLSLCTVLCVAHIVATLWTFSTHLTFSHLVTPSRKYRCASTVVHSYSKKNPE